MIYLKLLLTKSFILIFMNYFSFVHLEMGLLLYSVWNRIDNPGCTHINLSSILFFAFSYCIKLLLPIRILGKLCLKVFIFLGPN